MCIYFQSVFCCAQPQVSQPAMMYDNLRTVSGERGGEEMRRRAYVAVHLNTVAEEGPHSSESVMMPV